MLSLARRSLLWVVSPDSFGTPRITNRPDRHPDSRIGRQSTEARSGRPCNLVRNRAATRGMDPPAPVTRTVPTSANRTEKDALDRLAMQSVAATAVGVPTRDHATGMGDPSDPRSVECRTTRTGRLYESRSNGSDELSTNVHRQILRITAQPMGRAPKRRCD